MSSMCTAESEASPLPSVGWAGPSEREVHPLEAAGNEEALSALLAREPALLPPHAWLASHASVSPAQRAELAAWLRAAGAALGCSLAVVEHAAALLDRFLAAQRFQAGGEWVMQLAAVSSFLLACKLEDAGPGPGADRVQAAAPWPPFDPDTLARMEPTLLGALGWRTTALTPSNFVDRLMLHVGLGLGPGPAGALALAVRERAQALMAAAVTEGSLLDCRPSSVAAASVVLAAKEEASPVLAAAAEASLRALCPQTPMCMEVLEVYALKPCDSPNHTLTRAASDSSGRHPARGKQRDTTPQSVLTAEASPVGRGP